MNITICILNAYHTHYGLHSKFSNKSMIYTVYWRPKCYRSDPSGADLGNSGWGGRVCVNKGKALDRGTKCRAGGGYGRGVSPLPIWKKIKIRDCLDVF